MVLWRISLTVGFGVHFCPSLPYGESLAAARPGRGLSTDACNCDPQDVSLFGDSGY